MIKKCIKCFLEKDINEFWFSRVNVRHGECKTCKLKYDTAYKLSNPDKIAKRKERTKEATQEYHQKYRKINKERRGAYLKQWGKENPEKIRAQKYRNRYGCDIEDYNNMLEKQKNCCAICFSKDPQITNKKYFFIDHCHKTNRVRGLLCYLCNSLLGKAKDNVAILSSAIKYLNYENNN